MSAENFTHHAKSLSILFGTVYYLWWIIIWLPEEMTATDKYFMH